jgi:hypothetical protein
MAFITKRADHDFLNTMAPGKSYHTLFVDDGYTRKAPPVLAGQSNWRWCRKCQGLFFFGNPTNGVCPTGGSHDVVGSGNYVLSLNEGNGQPNWKWCFKCEGLYFGAIRAAPASAPPAAFTMASAAATISWRWTRVRVSRTGAGARCARGCSSAATTHWACARQQEWHDGSRSGNYFLPMTSG